MKIKKAEICFSSVCTNDSYSYYIPLFIYTVKRAYPEYGVKVFVIGKLKPPVKEALNLIPYDGWEVVENSFMSYPNGGSASNSLRFLVRKEQYKGYDYVFVKDIDFLIFRHKPTHGECFIKRMKNLPYFGVRGPYTRPRRYAVNRIGWKGNFTRVAGGSFAFHVRSWYTKAGSALDKYRRLLKHREPDDIDSHRPGSYREYDEVMLFRILKESGIKAPTRKGKSVLGYSAPKVYRDIHLGDFIKGKHGFNRLKKRLSPVNANNYLELEKDETWKNISSKMKANAKIRQALRRLKRHARSR